MSKLFPPVPFLQRSHQSPLNPKRVPSPGPDSLLPLPPPPSPSPCPDKDIQIPFTQLPSGETFFPGPTFAARFANCTPDFQSVFMYISKRLQTPQMEKCKKFHLCLSVMFQLGCRIWLNHGCYIWQMFRNATVTIPTAGRALPMDWLSSAALQSLHVVAQQC